MSPVTLNSTSPSKQCNLVHTHNCLMSPPPHLLLLSSSSPLPHLICPFLLFLSSSLPLPPSHHLSLLLFLSSLPPPPPPPPLSLLLLPPPPTSLRYLNDVFMLEIREGTSLQWQCPVIDGPTPCPRESHAAVTIGTRLLIYGGMNGRRLGDIWILDVGMSSQSSQY